MSPEQLERVRRREKETAYLREVGRPVSVDPAPCIEHVQKLHRRGMTGLQMAEQVGLGKTTVQDLIRGQRSVDKGHEVRRIPREVAEAVLSIRFEEPAGRGADVDSTGTRRRLQALTADGFSGRFLADRFELSNQRINALTLNEGPVNARVAIRVAGVYEKLAGTNPADWGITPYSISRALGTARRNGYAPSGCWDADTIDDPDAVPEWTGRCGTWIGARAHRREGIPMCPACEPHDLGTDVPGLVPGRLRELRERRGLSREAVGALIGVNESTIMYWESGRSVPVRNWKIDKLLSVLDATFEDVIEEAPSE